MSEATQVGNVFVETVNDNAARGSSGTRIFTGKLFRTRKGHGYTFTVEPPSEPKEPAHRPARIAYMLAFAHKLQEAIDRGEYRDRADAARQLGLTRARITQILDLTLLAPDIQEELLFLEAVDGREPVSERIIREIDLHENWAEQRRAWIYLSVTRSEPR